MTFVDLETARARRGLRLVVPGGVPSPWSEAAKGIVRMKCLDCVFVRTSVGDQAVKAWTGVHNAPVALHDDEPPRSGWHEILMLAERLDTRVPLVPEDAAARALMFGLTHEIASERGLSWCVRLLILQESFASDAARGFPLRLARYLGEKYGFAPERVEPARRRVRAILGLLAVELRRSGGDYFGGDRPNALDVHAATALAPLAPMPEAECPMLPVVRKAYADLDDEVKRMVPPELLAHRRLMYERHLGLPLEL